MSRRGEGWRHLHSLGRLTSRMAHRCLGSCSLILPFGNPHPADDFHPFTRMHCGRGKNKPYVSEGIAGICAATNLIPGVVEHDRATHGYTGLVLHEGRKLLVVILGPVGEKGAGVEEGF